MVAHVDYNLLRAQLVAFLDVIAETGRPVIVLARRVPLAYYREDLRVDLLLAWGKALDGRLCCCLNLKLAGFGLNWVRCAVVGPVVLKQFVQIGGGLVNLSQTKGYVVPPSSQGTSARLALFLI